MKPFVYLLAALCMPLPACAANQSGGLPVWAYPINLAAPAAPAAPDPTPLRVSGSDVTFTFAQTRDPYNVPDWHPNNHPAAPEIVLKGGGPGVLACGYCHLPNGLGRPENANLAGLPADYIVQQVADMKNDLRKSSEPKMAPPGLMHSIAKLATEEQVREAAKYFSALKPTPWIRVVETVTVPKSRVLGAMYVAIEGEPKELLGMRILEVPENTRQQELRDSGSGFVAYVPPRSIKRGEVIATLGVLSSGKGKVTPCVACHGADLRGLGPVPALAGRSPSYLVRQLYDLQQGHRKGPWSPLMKNVVENLDAADMVAIAAYASSRAP